MKKMNIDLSTDPQMAEGERVCNDLKNIPVEALNPMLLLSKKL
jgi:hypothetical protein